MAEPTGIGKCLAVKVNSKGKFDPGAEVADQKKREMVFFATSIDAALERAKFDGYLELTATIVDPDSTKNEPKYDLGLAWTRRHKPSGNFINDTYLIGGRVLE